MSTADVENKPAPPLLTARRRTIDLILYTYLSPACPTKTDTGIYRRVQRL